MLLGLILSPCRSDWEQEREGSPIIRIGADGTDTDGTDTDENSLHWKSGEKVELAIPCILMCPLRAVDAAMGIDASDIPARQNFLTTL